MAKEQSSPDTRNFNIYLDPGANGGQAEFGTNEYIELYQDVNGLSSSIWPIDIGADKFIEDAESLIGTPDVDKRGAVALSGQGMPDMLTARDTKLFVEQNLGRIAFCRIDFGSHSIIWQTIEDDDTFSAQGAVIFKTDDSEMAIKFVERTGTTMVRKYASHIIPELAQAIDTHPQGA